MEEKVVSVEVKANDKIKTIQLQEYETLRREEKGKYQVIRANYK